MQFWNKIAIICRDKNYKLEQNYIYLVLLYYNNNTAISDKNCKFENKITITCRDKNYNFKTKLHLHGMEKIYIYIYYRLWLMINDWWLMIDDWWLTIDDWWLIIDDWWLMFDDWWLTINDWCMMIDDW